MARRKLLATPATLIYCEGGSDCAFVRRIQQLYKPGKLKRRFDIQVGGGGSPEYLVDRAARRHGSFSKRVVVCDNDRGEKDLEAAQRRAKEVDLTLIYLTPCLEAVMLNILDKSTKYSSGKTDDCKKELHKKYLKKPKLSDLRNYTIITHSLVDKARASDKQLDELVGLFSEADYQSGSDDSSRFK